MTNDTRAAFEVWAKTEGFDITSKHHGLYGFDAPDTDYAWMGWLASRRAALEECAKLVEANHIVSGGNGPNFNFGWETALGACAAAIRALSDEGMKD